MRFGLSRRERTAAYRAFFTYCHSMLHPGGRLIIQTIGKGNRPLDQSSITDVQFLANEIFPESDPPRLAELTHASESPSKSVRRSTTAMTIRQPARNGYADCGRTDPMRKDLSAHASPMSMNATWRRPSGNSTRNTSCCTEFCSGKRPARCGFPSDRPAPTTRSLRAPEPQPPVAGSADSDASRSRLGCMPPTAPMNGG